MDELVWNLLLCVALIASFGILDVYVYPLILEWYKNRRQTDE